MFAALRLRGAFAALALLVASTSVSFTQNVDDRCAAAQANWTVKTIQACIEQITTTIDQASSTKQKATQLTKRAGLYERWGYALTAKSADRRQPALEAAVADYKAAIVLHPENSSLRAHLTELALRVRRIELALQEAEPPENERPNSARYQWYEGGKLAVVGRHEEAIRVYTRAIELAQFCAEASLTQRRANEFRRALAPQPQTAEEFDQMLKSRPLYDIPEAAVTMTMGFPCAPSVTNPFEDLVVLKGLMFESRAESHLALGDQWAALRDYEYSVDISYTRALASLGLCQLEIEMGLDYHAVEDCREAFDFNSYPLLVDADGSAKIGNFLLNDGDLKAACRIAYPWFKEGMDEYVNNPNIKALQKRVKGGLKGAGVKDCEAVTADKLLGPEKK